MLRYLRPTDGEELQNKSRSLHNNCWEMKEARLLYHEFLRQPMMKVATIVPLVVLISWSHPSLLSLMHKTPFSPIPSSS